MSMIGEAGSHLLQPLEAVAVITAMEEPEMDVAEAEGLKAMEGVMMEVNLVGGVVEEGLELRVTEAGESGTKGHYGGGESGSDGGCEGK